MQDNKRRLAELLEKYKGLAESLNLPEKKARLKELETQTLDPDLWTNPDNARGVMQKFADASKEIAEVESLGAEITALDKVEEISGLEKRLEKLTLTSFLSGVYDSKNAIVAIHAGQGGTEAMDWTGMLYRMYLRFCEKRGG